VEAAEIEPDASQKFYLRNQLVAISITVPESVWTPSSFPVCFSHYFPTVQVQDLSHGA